MDLSYNAVASKCAAQMAKYQSCIAANQTSDWQTICSKEGRALTECADNAVPYLRELKMSCAGEIAEYRKCLETNQFLPDDAVEEKCGGLMKRVWECSERTMKGIEARQAVQSGGGGVEGVKTGQGGGRLV